MAKRRVYLNKVYTLSVYSISVDRCITKLTHVPLVQLNIPLRYTLYIHLNDYLPVWAQILIRDNFTKQADKHIRLVDGNGSLEQYSITVATNNEDVTAYTGDNKGGWEVLYYNNVYYKGWRKQSNLTPAIANELYRISGDSD